MLVKVFMRRRFKEGKTRDVFNLIRKIRARAMNQKGYISGETFVNQADPMKTMVVGTWQDMDDWLAWKEDSGRKDLEAQLAELLEDPTQYEVYVYSKYRLGITGDPSLGEKKM